MQTQLAKGMIAAVMAVLSLAALAFAVVPGTFNYQGYLKNSDGTPVTAATAIRFTLYSSASGVAPLWTETRSVTPANGTYSVQLGATQPLSLPFDRRYYLGITVGADSEMRPLQQLDSVPYALRAAVADSTGPHSHSGADITGGTVADARLSTNVGLLGTAQTVTGLKTFAPASGSVPFAVGSGKIGVVTNLNAEMLEGKRIADLNGIYAPAILSKATVQDIATQTWTLTNSGAYLPGAPNPYEMAFDGANIWVPGSGVKKVRASDGVLIGNYATGSNSYGIAFDGQHIWVSNSGSNNLTKLVAVTGAPAGTFSLGDGAVPKGIAFDGANLWVANSGNNTVGKVGLNGTVLGTFAAGTTPTDVVSDGTNIWVANRGSNNISKLSKTGAVLGTYAVGVGPISLVFDGTYVWTANYGNRTVSRIKATDGTTSESFPVPAANPLGLAFDGSHVWVGDYYGYKACILRASDGVLVGTVQVDDYPQGLLFDGDNVWAALYTMGMAKLPAPAFTMTLSAGALNSGAVTTEKVADGAVTAAKLNINDNIRLNDKNLYLRGGSDTNHGLGWYGAGKSFGGSTLDGPALYGYTGGVLGTTSGGEKIALSWDLNKNVTFGSHLYLNGILNLDTAAKIQANGRDLYLAWDELHGLGWYGATKNFSATNVNGPVLYGFAGGALGTTNGGQKIALSWDSNKNMSAGGNLTLTGGLTLNGSLDLGSSATVQLKKRDMLLATAGDTLHGLGWYGSGKTFNGVNVNGPVLYGNGGGALGIAPNGTDRRIVFQWEGDGSTRLHDNTLYLRGNGGDTAHGLGWFNNSSKPFMNNTESFDGPILYGAGGGALGTNGNPGRLVLKWYNDGRVVIPGNLSKGSGSFKIDHPLDPTGKYLYHSFVESPDMMNIYNGVTVTDARGYATIELPDWFEALNRDFRYQLTVIDETDGADFIQAKVVKGVGDNRFTIRSSAPLTKISWQVTGIRKDPYAEAHRIPVEEAKPSSEQGTCLHQEACR